MNDHPAPNETYPNKPAAPSPSRVPGRLIVVIMLALVIAFASAVYLLQPGR